MPSCIISFDNKNFEIESSQNSVQCEMSIKKVCIVFSFISNMLFPETVHRAIFEKNDLLKYNFFQDFKNF